MTMIMSTDNMAELPPIMTLKEAADACRLHNTTLRRAIRAGRLRASKPTGRDIRITATAIKQWLELTTTNPKGPESLMASQRTKSSKLPADPSGAPATASPEGTLVTSPFDSGGN